MCDASTLCVNTGLRCVHISASMKFWVVPLFSSTTTSLSFLSAVTWASRWGIFLCLSEALQGRWEHCVFATCCLDLARTENSPLFCSEIVQSPLNHVRWRWLRVLNQLACRGSVRRSKRGILLSVDASFHGKCSRASSSKSRISLSGKDTQMLWIWTRLFFMTKPQCSSIYHVVETNLLM